MPGDLAQEAEEAGGWAGTWRRLHTPCVPARLALGPWGPGVPFDFILEG